MPERSPQSEAAWRGHHACKVCGGTNVIRRPAKKNDPGEFEGCEYKECTSCGDVQMVRTRQTRRRAL